MIPASIKRLDYRPIAKIRDEIQAFLVVRNEALRLPATLRHHRAITAPSPRHRRATLLRIRRSLVSPGSGRSALAGPRT